jgi:hypothetical protein
MAAQNALVDRLAATYGFDVERPIQFDRQQKLITQEDPGPAAEARPPATSS